MTTTAHEDQFIAAPEPVRQPYDTASILRRNVAEIEVALRTQTERAEAAEAELAKLREQKPVAWMREDGNLYLAWQKDLCLPEVRFSPLYTAPASHKGATHCDDCGLTWLDDGLNPLRCPYCENAALRADSARIDWLADVNNTVGSVVLPRHIVEQNISSLRQAIDAAMTAKTTQEPAP